MDIDSADSGWADLGWFGSARQVRLPGMTDRLAAAIAERAAELGVEVGGLETLGPHVMIVTGTAKAHLGADKLCAYIDGLTDALSDSYGKPPVEVSRKDLARLLNSLGSMFASPDLTAAAERLRKALDEPPQQP